MTVYNFKKELKLYIVRAGLRYVLDIYPDISFSQTFSETAVPVKTLHSQRDMFENAVITKANPANFSFTTPILLEQDLDIVLQMLLDWDDTSTEASLKTADLYVEMNSEVYKLEKAVFDSGVFQIVKDKIITINCSGTAKKLSKYIGVIPGTLQSRSDTTSYSIPTSLEIMISGVVQTRIASVSLEVKNNVQWVDYTTLQNSSVINSASDTMYPEVFVVQSRTVSGSVQQYVTDETNSNVNLWQIGTPLAIRTGSLNAGRVLDIAIPGVVYTNRIDLQEFLMQSYDFRMITNPAKLSDVIKHLHLTKNLGEFTGIWAAI